MATDQELAAAALKAHQESLRPKPKLQSDVHKDWLTDTRPRWQENVVQPMTSEPSFVTDINKS